jgi:hypothetical protein
MQPAGGGVGAAVGVGEAVGAGVDVAVDDGVAVASSDGLAEADTIMAGVGRGADASPLPSLVELRKRTASPTELRTTTPTATLISHRG